RGIGGLAVVLAGLGDAEALLGLELGLRRRTRLGARRQRHGEGGDHGGRDDEVPVHVTLLSDRGCRPPAPAAGLARRRRGVSPPHRAPRFGRGGEPPRRAVESNRSMSEPSSAAFPPPESPPRPWHRLSVRLACLLAAVTVLAVAAVGGVTYERHRRE